MNHFGGINYEKRKRKKKRKKETRESMMIMTL